MPRHNTERAQAIRARNSEIVRHADLGWPQKDVARITGCTVSAVQAVMARHRNAKDTPVSVRRTNTETSHRVRAMVAEGLEHVSGWIDAEDKPKFRRLVAKAATVVERVTKGDE